MAYKAGWKRKIAAVVGVAAMLAVPIIYLIYCIANYA